MNFERLFKKVVISLLVLMLLPTIVQLIVHIVHEVISQPTLIPAAAPVQHNGGFGAGVLITLIGLLLVVGLLTRIGRALRNPEAARYRAAIDRRARTLPRFSAEADEVPVHGTGMTPEDPDPELPWE